MNKRRYDAHSLVHYRERNAPECEQTENKICFRLENSYWSRNVYYFTCIASPHTFDK